MRKKTRKKIESLENRIHELEKVVQVRCYNENVSAYPFDMPINEVIDILMDHLKVRLVKIPTPWRQAEIESIEKKA